MKIIDLMTGEPVTLSEHDRISCALGNFDGVHLGHQALISLAAKKEDATKSAVFTFDIPSSRMTGGISLLLDPEERYERFRALGIELLFLADFALLRGLSHEAFARDVLFLELHVRHAVCGFNFHYGAGRKGTPQTLADSFALLGGRVTTVAPVMQRDMIVSSSEIRRALSEGNVESASRMLGYPYAITGEIIHGKKLGRTLGFPTANQMFPAHRALPRFGVYAVRMTVDGRVYHGVSNVGLRPTVEHSTAVNAETFLFDFEGELYGKTVKTEFLTFLRPEKRFSSVDELKAAVYHSIDEARAYFERMRG